MASAVNARVLVLSLAVCRLFPGTRAACYYPSGLQAPNDTPCRDDTPHATCCGPGYACLSNGIRQATGEELKKPGASEFVRGSCTDKTWRSSNCPLFCINEQYDYLDGGTGIAKCENTSNDLYVCIDGQESSCEEGINVLYFPGTPSALTTIGVAASTTSSSSSSSSSTAASSTSSQDSSTTTPPEPTRATETQTVPNEEDTSSSSSSSSSSSNVGAIVGGTIGGVAVAVLAGAGGWLLARKRAERAYAVGDVNVNGTGMSPPSGGGYQPPPDQKLSYGGTPSYYDAPGEPHTLSPYPPQTQQHPYGPYGPYEMAQLPSQLPPQQPHITELSSDRPLELPADHHR